MLAQALLYFALLMLISAIMGQLCGKVFRVNIFLEKRDFLSLYITQIIFQIKSKLFFWFTAVEKIKFKQAKQSKARVSKAFILLMDLALLCFALVCSWS